MRGRQNEKQGDEILEGFVLNHGDIILGVERYDSATGGIFRILIPKLGKLFEDSIWPWKSLQTVSSDHFHDGQLYEIRKLAFGLIK